MGKILVVSRGQVVPFYGVVPGLVGYWAGEEWLRRQPLTFKERDTVEKDPAWKQPIPYCLLARERAQTGETEYFFYRRPGSTAETRLHGKVSIGIGGHVDYSDLPADSQGDVGSLSDVVRCAAHREVLEEVNFAPELPSAIPLAMINHDDTEVASVHFGVVYEVSAVGKVVTPSDELTEVGWGTVGELESRRDEMEGWSQMLLSWLRGRALV